MKVVLTQDVANVGKRFAVVELPDGYVRNRLLPKGLAREATAANIRWARNEAARSRQSQTDAAAAVAALRDAIGQDTLQIKCAAGDAGQLFGSVGPKDIADAVRERFGVTLQPAQLHLPDPVKQVGTYEVRVTGDQEELRFSIEVTGADA